MRGPAGGGRNWLDPGGGPSTQRCVEPVTPWWEPIMSESTTFAEFIRRAGDERAACELLER